MGSAIAGSVALHAPHLPMSARCFAGIRFDFPQDGQFRMIAKVEPSIECRVSSISPMGKAKCDRLLKPRPYLAWQHGYHKRIFSHDKQPLFQESTTRAHPARREEAATKSTNPLDDTSSQA